MSIRHNSLYSSEGGCSGCNLVAPTCWLAQERSAHGFGHRCGIVRSHYLIFKSSVLTRPIAQGLALLGQFPVQTWPAQDIGYKSCRTRGLPGSRPTCESGLLTPTSMRGNWEDFPVLDCTFPHPAQSKPALRALNPIYSLSSTLLLKFAPAWAVDHGQNSLSDSSLGVPASPGPTGPGAARCQRPEPRTAALRAAFRKTKAKRFQQARFVWLRLPRAAAFSLG